MRRVLVACPARGARRVLVACALATAGLLAAAPAAAEPSPAHDYLLSCAGCHRFDGTGSTRVPSLRGLGPLLARTGGRAYLLRVPGVAQAPLSDARLAALLNWLLANFDDTAPVPPFAAAEVRAARAQPLIDPRQARATLR